MNPRQQGDVGERAAAAWLLSQDAVVAYPFGQHAAWDLVAEIDGCLYRVQVKTSTRYSKGRWLVAVCTRGGNQSWNGMTKPLDTARFDYLFVLVGDGRQWFIPSRRIKCLTALSLGGRKYARHEVEPSEPLYERMRRQVARTKLFVPSGGAPELESRTRL